MIADSEMMRQEQIKNLTRPFVIRNYRAVAWAVLVVLLCSLLALLFAPLLMPASYDWIRHTTSESAAQGIHGAWLARLGFMLYGLAVLVLAMAQRHYWGRAALLLHASFGMGMIGNAVFASRPWLAGVAFDHTEDLLHSWMSGLVGTAFSLGVLAILFQRDKAARLAKSFDVVALGTSISVSLLMLLWADSNGLIQRIMFTVAYVWYAREAFIIVQGIESKMYQQDPL